MRSNSLKTLLKAVDAAGYAMAPSEDDLAETEPAEPLELITYEQPEVAFRNGHVSAARAVSRHLAPIEHVMGFADPARFHWLRDLIAGRWAGRAAA